MTRLIHDQFAKEYWEELLSPFGTVQISRPILAEVREVDPTQFPKVWIITPTASEVLREIYRAYLAPDWPDGIYGLASALLTAIVAVHQLPRTPETLWLRLLGQVQQQAIDE